jgi:hypothetical protein
MRKQLDLLMEACGEDLSLRASVRKVWVLHHWPRAWVKRLDPDAKEISRMAKQLITRG